MLSFKRPIQSIDELFFLRTTVWTTQIQCVLVFAIFDIPLILLKQRLSDIMFLYCCKIYLSRLQRLLLLKSS